MRLLFRIGRMSEQQVGEVVPECAAGADAAPVELAFLIAAGAVEVVEDAGAGRAAWSSTDRVVRVAAYAGRSPGRCRGCGWRW